MSRGQDRVKSFIKYLLLPMISLDIKSITQPHVLYVRYSEVHILLSE